MSYRSIDQSVKRFEAKKGVRLSQLTARGEAFPSHCKTYGGYFETSVAGRVGALLKQAGWRLVTPETAADASSAVSALRAGLLVYPGFSVGAGSAFEGIYFSEAEPSRLLHVETSGSPPGKNIGGFAKSCTMHKVDSRLQMSLKIAWVMDLQLTGLLISNYVPKPGSMAAGTLLGLCDVMPVHYVLTDQAGRIVNIMSRQRLRRDLAGSPKRRVGRT